MDTSLPPDAWRSEAFAEDLGDDGTDRPHRPDSRRTLRALLLGALPMALAATGVALAFWPAA